MTEIAGHADFSFIRYAQCWEDADVLLAALAMRPGARCLSICSAGDNTLALLTTEPRSVVAVDLSPAQIACLQLRIAAYRTLEHRELLELVGSIRSDRRPALYRRCRNAGLPADARTFWDACPDAVARGIGAAGKFEAYFGLFRRRLLPLVHSRRTINDLLQPRPAAQRREFYDQTWNTRRWRLLFKLFFSRRVMGLLGRDASFFRYVKGSVAERILARARYALVDLDPSSNPYLRWILTEQHGDALPLALRPQHFDTIRRQLDKVRVHQGSIESLLETPGGQERFDAFNLSDIFEYMSEPQAETLLRRLHAAASPGARLVYWNMLTPRSRPPSMADLLEPLDQEAGELFKQDSAFFYSRLVIECVRPPAEDA